MKKKRLDDFPYRESISKIIRVMKLVSFLLLSGFLQVMAANVHSQNANIKLSMHDATLSEVIKAVQTQTEFTFFYSPDDIKDVIVSRVELENASLEKTLDLCLKGTNLDYEIVHKSVILKKGKESIQESPDVPAQQLPQKKEISGSVKDSKGLPLPGVSVVVKGTTTGTITDADGKFILSVPADAKMLAFSFVGMKTQEIVIGNNATINVALAEEIVGMEEIVAVGYGTQKKVSLTGSVVELKSEKIINTPVANISNTLAGRLPGIFAVQRSGEPGLDAADISIRGFGNALIIVDGIERSSIQFNQIDPNTIESISVLKDASASIYGARAGNGVILVTTKRGKTGKPLINFNVSNAYQSTTRLPGFINSGEFAVSFNDALRAVGAPAYFSDFQVKEYRSLVGESVDFTAAEKSQFNTDKPYLANTDWIGAVFKPVAPIQQYNLNSTGGNDKIKYFLSLGYLDQKSVLRSGNDNFKKYTIQSNIDAQISKDLSVGFDLSARLSKTEYPGYPIGWIWNTTLNDIPTNPLNKDPRYPTGYGQGTSEASGYRKNDTKDLIASVSANYSVPFVKGLSAKARFDYSTTTGFDKNFVKAYQLYTYDIKNDIYTPKGGLSGGSTFLAQNYSESRSLLSKIMLEYENVFGKHAIKALAVGEYTDFSNNFFSAERTGYLSDAIDQLFAGSSTGLKNNGGEVADGRISYASRLNYAYSDKYLLETTLRYDASPRFAPDQRWGLFPSVLVGWRLSEESFMKNKLKFINNLKLRLSYGQSGVDNIASYNYLSGFSYAGGFVDNAAFQLGLQTKGLANLAATWEKHTTYNAGIDFDLWNSKIYGGFDVFYKERSGILAKRIASLPSTFGATLPSENLNSINYRGFELQLGHTGKIGELKFKIDGNIAWARAKNGHIEEPNYSAADKYTKLRYQKSGQWTNQFYGLDAVGLFQSQAEINAWPVIQDGNNNTTLRPGDIKYLDFDGDKKITQLDYHVIGRGNTPELNYGLNINGNWKGFDLSMLWYGATDYSTLLPLEVPYGPIPSTILKVQLDYWTPQNTGASLPRMVNGGATNNKYPSSFWLKNSYYLRLKNIQLGYSLPPRIFKSIGMSNCRVYLSAVNWLTISNIKNFDPETVSTSGAYGFFPQQKTLSFGINMSF